jgi:hypothetical protein
MIRTRLSSTAGHARAAVGELEEELQVFKHAITLVARTPESDLSPFAHISKEADGDLRRINLAEVEDYSTFLHEAYRSPSKGGNTTALHRHVMTIGGERYSFFARGSRKWVYKGDKASFNYVLTPDGYRNIRQRSLITFDNNGTPVLRGDRRAKPVLRTAKQRLPGSRREARG